MQACSQISKSVNQTYQSEMLQFDHRKAFIGYHSGAIDSFIGGTCSPKKPLEPDNVNFLTLDELAKSFSEELKANLYYTHVNYDRYFRDLMRDLILLDKGYQSAVELYRIVNRLEHAVLQEEDDVYFTLCTFYSSLNTTMDEVEDCLRELGATSNEKYKRTIPLLLDDYSTSFLDEYPVYDRLTGVSSMNSPEGITAQDAPSLKRYLGEHADVLMPFLVDKYKGAEACDDISVTILALQGLKILPGNSQLKLRHLYTAIKDDLRVEFGERGFTGAYRRNDPHSMIPYSTKAALEKKVSLKQKEILEFLNP